MDDRKLSKVPTTGKKFPLAYQSIESEDKQYKEKCYEDQTSTSGRECTEQFETALIRGGQLLGFFEASLVGCTKAIPHHSE